MTRPLVFIDFDGVINQFPDDKVIRRQGRTDWMEPDDPRRDTYSPDNWFGPDRRGAPTGPRPWPTVHDPVERGARRPTGCPGRGQMVADHLAAGNRAIEPGVGRRLADRPMV